MEHEGDEIKKEHEEHEHHEHKVEEPHEHEVHHKPESLTSKMRDNPWIMSTLVLGILALVLLTGSFSGITGSVISADEAGQKILDFAKTQGGQAEIIEINDDGSFYEVVINFQGQNMPLYVTKDGKYFTQSLVPLIKNDFQEPEPQDIPKSDKPKVELFVMTHCPYGTQAEKGIIPAIKTLGDAIDAKIRFVHYFMHEPEETETPIQVCVREEQPEKWYDYLKCFLEDGDSDRCLAEAGVDKIKVSECINNGNAEKYYAEDSELSENYGVQGSPTLVVNGEIVSSSRSPAAYLDIICQAFNEAPEMCGTELSTATPPAMWGWEGSGADSGAQC